MMQWKAYECSKLLINAYVAMKLNDYLTSWSKVSPPYHELQFNLDRKKVCKAILLLVDKVKTHLFLLVLQLTFLCNLDSLRIFP